MVISVGVVYAPQIIELGIEQTAEMLGSIRLSRYSRMLELEVVNDSAMEFVQRRGILDPGQPHNLTIGRLGQRGKRCLVAGFEDLAVTEFGYEGQPVLVHQAPRQSVEQVDQPKPIVALVASKDRKVVLNAPTILFQLVVPQKSKAQSRSLNFGIFQTLREL
jgi:hypothetical protein